MSRTTDQWEALLEGTSSGNWVVRVGGVEVFAVTDHSRSFVADAGAHLLSCRGEALTEARKDAALIAAAPEAVAEVVRLRRELETMRGWAESLGTGRPGGPQVAQKITNIIDQEDTDE